jgi:2-dehydropantoate 2-reductase
VKGLVCGAGIQGSYLAAYLNLFGAEVYLLARGQKLQALQKRGVRYQSFPSQEIKETKIPVVSEITADYDVIFVTMQKQQAISFSEDLTTRRGEATVVYLGNNGTATADYDRYVPTESILLGFLLMGGYRREDYIRVISAAPLGLVLGAPTPEAQSRLVEVVAFLEDYAIRVDVPSDIDAWLKSHLALILPLAGGVYGAGIDNFKLAKTPALLKLTAKGLKEAYKVVRKAGYPFLPRRLGLLAKLPERLLVSVLRRRMATESSEIAMAGHAGAARSEMQHLASEFQHLIAQSGVHTPNFDKLMQFLDPNVPVVEEGTENLP